MDTALEEELENHTIEKAMLLEGKASHPVCI